MSNTFSNHYGETGGFVLATSSSFFNDTSSTFTNGGAHYAGVGYVVNSYIALSESVITGSYAKYAGLIYAMNNSFVDLKNVKVSNTTVSEYIALVYTLYSYIYITE